jgi:hypothetical protein
VSWLPARLSLQAPAHAIPPRILPIRWQAARWDGPPRRRGAGSYRLSIRPEVLRMFFWFAILAVLAAIFQALQAFGPL